MMRGFLVKTALRTLESVGSNAVQAANKSDDNRWGNCLSMKVSVDFNFDRDISANSAIFRISGFKFCITSRFEMEGDVKGVSCILKAEC